jgi:phytoene desaturase
MNGSKSAIIIGSGFSGLSAATHLASKGWQVTVLEKHSIPGGRARQFVAQGFTFDMGPSWYWMPDVFERYFNCFGKKVSDFYELIRLDPSYTVFFKNEKIDLPAGTAAMIALFENIETGAGKKLEHFLAEGAYKYKVGVQKLVYKPGQSILEFVDVDVIKGIFKLDIFTNMQSHIEKYFKDYRLQKLMEFPVLFLGALAKNTPALYSLMNYSDIDGGTWYPAKGMHQIVTAMHEVAVQQGVQFLFNENVNKIIVSNNKVTAVQTDTQTYNADVVISSADYNHTEQQLLPASHRQYTKAYWEDRKMAPSSLLYYIGLNKKMENIQHHSLFFDTNFEQHASEIYDSKTWPKDPLFYMSVVSQTDASSAPPNCENVFILIPIAAGLQGDTETVRNQYLHKILERLKTITGNDIADNIIYCKSYAVSDFISDYNAFKGNAYGLANTLLQTAILKPSIKNKKLSNMYYTGQLTTPGPGVPPSLISGEVVANVVHSTHYSL